MPVTLSSTKGKEAKMALEEPKCPKCGGASCLIGAAKLKDEMRECHECDHKWPAHPKKEAQRFCKQCHRLLFENADDALCKKCRAKLQKVDTSAEVPTECNTEPQSEEPPLRRSGGSSDAQPAEPEPEPEAEPTPVKTPLHLSAAQAQLESLYDQLNAKLFGGKLPSIVITIQSKGRKQAVAWYAHERWEDGEKQASSEINFCAENLTDGKPALVETMIHEMVHAMNARDGIKDHSASGRYHNKKFMHAAEAVGLTVEKSTSCGWAHTSLGPRLKDIVSEVNLQEDAFDMARKLLEKKGKDGTKLVKWTCGCRNFWMKTDGEGILCELCGNKFAKGC